MGEYGSSASSHFAVTFILTADVTYTLSGSLTYWFNLFSTDDGADLTLRDAKSALFSTNVPGGVVSFSTGGALTPGQYSLTADAVAGYRDRAEFDLSFIVIPGSPQLLRFDTSPGALQWTSQGLKLRLNSLTGHGPVILYASSDLKSWSPIYTNPPTTGWFQYIDVAATNLPSHFYPAVAMP